MAPSSLRATALRASAAALSLLLFGCATDAASDGRPGAPLRGADLDAADGKSSRAAQRKVAAAREKLEVAEVNVQVERLEAAAQGAEAEEDLRAAEVALDEARTARAAFDVEAEIRGARSEEEVASAESRVLSEQADLAGIRAIYAVEVEARAKDEILRRHENDVLRAERALALTRREHEQLTGATLPAERRELDEQVLAAAAKVRAKRHALEVARLAAAKAELAARHELEEARAELQSAEAPAEDRE